MRPALHLVCLVAVCLTAAGSARADGVLEELSAGTTPRTPGAPSASWLADKLAGVWEPGEDWQVRLDASGTRYFHMRADDVTTADLAAEYDAGHWPIRLTVGGSPAASVDTSVAVKAMSARGTEVAGDGGLQSTTSSMFGALSIGYETAGDSDAETTLNASATATSLAATQQLTSVRGRNGQAITLDQVRAFCAMRPCTSGLADALDGATTPLVELALAAGISEQLYQHTELGLDGTYYFYDRDPAQIGALSLTRGGQLTTSGALGIAPTQYSAMPSLIEHVGSVLAMTSVAYSKYVDDQGWALDATLRLQVKLAFGGDTRLKLWAKLIASRDVDQTGAVSRAGSLSLGTQYSW